MTSTTIGGNVIRPYEPTYDLLVDATLGQGTGYAPTYWVASAGNPRPDDGPIRGETDADVVVIGSGSTGMSTALDLAREHGIAATVLEAVQTSWGCSSRSGGQRQNANGVLMLAQSIERWGLDVAKKLDTEIRLGLDNFRQLTKEIGCEAYDSGHLYMEHRSKKLDYLREMT